ncbi:MAG: ATP synthase F1 subunit epsilon [Candidatus Omnitrophica bacterium]|nr:ATP synthase F1 subunit epsilon [Candidatus Omnitrophota bacterium]
MKSFKCSLITPQGMLFDDTVTSVVAPGVEGIFAVMAGHEHIVAALQKGILKIANEKVENYYAIDSGVLEVDGNRNVVVLADTAIKADNHDDAKIKTSQLENS